METFPMDKSVKKNSPQHGIDSKAEEAESLMDMSQALLQFLGNVVPTGGALLSPLLLAQASGSLVPAAAQVSLPWMLPAQYQQLMILQQGLAPQLLLPGANDFSDALSNDKARNQLEATAEANPLLAAILQRHSVNQKQLQQKVDDQDRNVNASALSLTANNSLLNVAGVSLQNIQLDGIGRQTGSWSLGTGDGVHRGKQVQSETVQQQLQQQQQLQLQQLQQQQLQQQQLQQQQMQQQQLQQQQLQLQQQQLQQQQLQQQQQQRPRPPKKPLTPYMIFSKEVWHQVKAANSHLSSVTEIGAIVGRLWRDLDPEKKEPYNEMFNENKARYDEELRVYLKKNNLRPSDIIRSRVSRRHNTSSSLNLSKLNEATKQLSSGRSHDVFGSSAHDFAGQSVQQILGQLNFSGETIFPSGIAVSTDMSKAGQTQIEAGSANVQEHLQHVSTTSPAASSPNTGKSIGTSNLSWSWHQPVTAANDAHGSTYALARNGVTEQPLAGQSVGETSSSSQAANYYDLDGLDQLLKLKPGQNENKLRELARISNLQMKILQLESALTERTQKAVQLRQELEEANSVIAHLKVQQSSQLMEAFKVEGTCSS